MSDRDPQRLQYATRETDADAIDVGASNCFLLGVFTPPLMILFAVAGYGVAGLSSMSLGLLLPHQFAVVTGLILGGLVTAVLPVIGLRMGIEALRQNHARPFRNRWQAVAGVCIHAILLACVAIVLYRLLAER